MTNDPVYNRLLETSWRRKLTPGEQAELNACLKAHPEWKADWEAEAALNAQLSKLKEPELSSNFTARVLQQIARPEPQQTRARSRWTYWMLRLLAPAAAVAVVVLTLQHQHAEAEYRRQLARSVPVVSEVASLPNVEILKNFEAIRELNSAPGPDEQLISLLQ